MSIIPLLLDSFPIKNLDKLEFNLPSLFRQAAQKHLEGSEFVFFDAVKDNRKWEVRSEFIEKILFLNDSDIVSHLLTFEGTLRIHNVHTIEDQIQKSLIEELTRNHKAFSCNLYFSPSEMTRGAGFHIDHQNTYAIQLMGMKKWFFGNAQSNFSDDAKSINPIVLMPGQTLYIPLGLAHRALSVKGHSIHLSFAENICTSRELAFAFMNQLESKIGALSIIDERDPDNLRDRLSEILAHLDLDSLVCNFFSERNLIKLRYVKYGRDRRQLK